MSQHVLLSAAARRLSVREVLAMSDAQAFERFRAMRWGREGEAVCPACGVAEQPWFLPSRRQWRGRACGHTVSVTSGRMFAHRKLPLQVYLGAIAIYTHRTCVSDMMPTPLPKMRVGFSPGGRVRSCALAT